MTRPAFEDKQFYAGDTMLLQQLLSRFDTDEQQPSGFTELSYTVDEHTGHARLEVYVGNDYQADLVAERDAERLPDAYGIDGDGTVIVVDEQLRRSVQSSLERSYDGVVEETLGELDEQFTCIGSYSSTLEEHGSQPPIPAEPEQ